MPRKSKRYFGMYLSLNDRVIHPIRSPPQLFSYGNEPFAQCPLLLGRGTIVHDPHRYGHHITIDSGQRDQQFSVFADHG